MNELWEQVLRALHAIRLKRYLIILFAWIFCSVGWYWVMTMPDKYQAKAQVYVDTRSLLKPLLKGLTVEVDSDQEVRLIAQTLKSRPNLETVITTTDLSLFLNPNNLDRDIQSLEQEIVFTADRRENLFNLEFEFQDPEVARQVVQKMLDIFMERTLGESRTEGDSARQFIQSQIIEYEQRLRESDLKITQFKQRNSGLLPEDGKGYYAALAEQRALADKTELELKENRSQLATARNRLSQEPKFLGQGTLGTDPFATRIAQMEKNLDEMQLQYTDQHPDIRELKRRISELRSQQSTAPLTSSNTTAANVNPVFEQLKVLVTRLESSTASLQVRLESYRGKVHQLEEKVYLIPGVEAELAELTRGYNINLDKYEALLNRRDNAELAYRADATTDNIQFNIIDPPRAADKPSGPDRPLLLSAVTVVGLLGGIALAFIVSQLNPVVLSIRDITEGTGFPVLGSVSQVPELTHSHPKVKTLIFSLGLVLVLGAYGFLMLWQLELVHPNDVVQLAPWLH
jgi:polysaccharide chain length determinant protein (PEP-CTERM system associated)